MLLIVVIGGGVFLGVSPIAILTNDVLRAKAKLLGRKAGKAVIVAGFAYFTSVVYPPAYSEALAAQREAERKASDEYQYKLWLYRHSPDVGADDE